MLIMVNVQEINVVMGGGYCGVNSDYCSRQNRCQPEYGICSTKCGGVWGSCPEGQCRNKNGRCGTGSFNCSLSAGCQPELGECTE